MRRVVPGVALLCALAGCGSGAHGRDAAAGSGGEAGAAAGGEGGGGGSAGAGMGGAAGTLGSGRGGAGGTAGASAGGRGGASGGGGSGGSAGANADGGGDADASTGAGGDGSGLPACAISTRPADPTNAGNDGGLISSMGGTCNSIVLTGPWVNRGCFDRQGDGGVEDGGVFEGPAGGTIRDGDYEVFLADGSLSSGSCQPDATSGTTRRTIRVFGGGTYIEWGGTNRPMTGTDTSFWYDTTVSASGHTLTFVKYDCGDIYTIASYGYTATADEFTYFSYSDNADGAGYLQFVVRYRRTCWR